VAVTTVAALGDLTRFDHPRHLMKCWGLIPSESSRGERRRQGSITTAGNTQPRRALVEGAWAYRDPAQVSRHLQLRLETPLKAIQDISGNAHVRLGTRDQCLMARGTHANPVVVMAMAHALVGFMWAMAQPVAVALYSLLTPVMATCTEKVFNGEVSHVRGKRRRPGVVSPSTV
jgi:transposase